MSTQRLLFVFSFIFAWTLNSQAARFDKVEVGSVYDDSRGRMFESFSTFGTGVIVGAQLSWNPLARDCRNWVLTAAHLTQGKNTWVKINDRPVAILGRLVDNRYDVELLEIESCASEPIARFDDSTQRYVATLETVRENKNEMYLSRLKVSIPIILVGMDPRDDRTHSYGPMVVIDSPSTSTPPKSSEFLHFLTATDSYKSTISREWIIHSRMTPGMSGSALLRQIEPDDSRYEIVGIVSQYDSERQLSFFASEAPIARLFLEYQKKRRGLIEDAVRWRATDSQLYRDFGGGTLESIVYTAPAGHGLRIDGTRSAQTVGAKKIETNPPAEPGMMFKGQRVQGFAVTLANQKTVFLEADRSTLALFDIGLEMNRIDPISVRSEVLPYLRKRLHLLLGKQSDIFEGVGAKTQWSSDLLNTKEDAFEPALKIKVHPQELVVELELTNLNQRCVFTFDSFGKLLSTSGVDLETLKSSLQIVHFSPIGRGAESYNLDLRGLYWFELSTAQSSPWMSGFDSADTGEIFSNPSIFKNFANRIFEQYDQEGPKITVYKKDRIGEATFLFGPDAW